jgi:molybdenum cofactor cytidylyltransferase/nicotine blue oxidoreductase
VLIERELYPSVKALRGDTGARDVLRTANVRDVPCDGLGSPRDVDTPADL